MANKVSENLVDLAESYKHSYDSTLRSKPVTSNYYITACHTYSDGSMEDELKSKSLEQLRKENQLDKYIGAYGYDWFFVEQKSILNGQPGFVHKWAKTRQNVEGVSWYIGQGEVVLNYVDYYEMESYIKDGNQYGIQLIDVSPVSKNNVTQCTSGVEFSIGGSVGFEAGKDSDGGKGSGNASLSWQAGFSESKTFEVSDCTVTNLSKESSNQSKVKWNYNFKGANQKGAGHLQRIDDPAKLAISTFTPTNMWIWKVPTIYREEVKAFISRVSVHTINTITRYSGSQDAKNVEARNQDGATEIKLSYPPLLSIESDYLTFDKDGGSKEVAVLSESKDLDIKVQGDWLSAEITSQKKGKQVLLITVNKSLNGEKRKGSIVIERNGHFMFEKVSNPKESITITINQVEKVIKD